MHMVQKVPEAAQSELWMLVKDLSKEGYCIEWSTTERGVSVVLDESDQDSDTSYGKFLNALPTWVESHANPNNPRELDLNINAEAYHRYTNA